MASSKATVPPSETKRNGDQISFSLNVIATNLPLEHKDFKIKLEMQFGKPFSPEFTNVAQPNFNAKRVRSILHFISDKVIRKVIEYIYFKRDYVYEGKPYKLNNDETVNKIYAERSKYRKTKALETKPNLKEEEELIARIVEKFLENDKREIPIQEKNIEAIYFEQLSPAALAVSARDIVNGDMPPPR
jgi:hypothetical protein